MAAKRDTKAMKRGKKVKDLRVKSMSSRRAKSVKGGKPGVIEISDFSFGVENPISVGSSGQGTSAGKVDLNQLNIKKP